MELLVVIAVVAVLASVVTPSFNQMLATMRVKNASSSLFLALTKARSEAVKRNTAVELVPELGDWNAGWKMRCDGPDVDPDLDLILERQEGFPGVSVDGDAASLVYLRSGRTRGNVVAEFSIHSDTAPDVGRCITLDSAGRPNTQTSACPP